MGSAMTEFKTFIFHHRSPWTPSQGTAKSDIKEYIEGLAYSDSDIHSDFKDTSNQSADKWKLHMLQHLGAMNTAECIPVCKPTQGLGMYFR